MISVEISFNRKKIRIEVNRINSWEQGLSPREQRYLLSKKSFKAYVFKTLRCFSKVSN